MRLVCSLMIFYSLYHIPHNLKKLIDLIERAFKQFCKNEGTLYLAWNDKKAFFISSDFEDELDSQNSIDQAYGTLVNTITVAAHNHFPVKKI